MATLISPISTQALTLLTAGWDIDKIIEYTTLSRSQIYAIAQKAKKEGFQPKINHTILAEYCEDSPKSGRPKKTTPEKKETVRKC